ncbi:MAG: hypothetical protein KAT34_13520 [Candidatus Aminicenantes bacterium]|nr:hypothetical protein [Candidatus Aminicenantes bacterium]
MSTRSVAKRKLPKEKISLFSQPAPLVVLSESQLKAQVPYDAWVEFKDKGIVTEKQRQKILKDLKENFNPDALLRRKETRQT